MFHVEPTPFSLNKKKWCIKLYRNQIKEKLVSIYLFFDQFPFRLIWKLSFYFSYEYSYSDK